jgi:flavin-dependent dehydrogenase
MYDAVVVGAGLAGLHTSRVLAQRGARVLLVDRKTSPDAYVHTTGIFVRRTLESFGFPDGLLGEAIRDVTLHSPTGRTIDLQSPQDEFRLGRMHELYRYLLERCLAHGVELSMSTSYVSSEVDGRWSLVRLRSGNRTRSLRTRFIIGADGARSRVAADLALDQNSSFILGAEEIHGDTRAKVVPRLHAFLDPRLAPGYIGWVTEDGHAIHIGTGGSSSFNLKASVAKLRDLAGEITGQKFSLPGERRGGLIPAGGVLNRIASRRGLLVGDAAGAVSPLTAGGLDGALRLSDYAAHVVAEALEQYDPSIVLRYRGDLLRTRFTSRIWMRKIIEQMRSPLLAEAGFRLLETKALQPFVRQVFFGRGSFPDPATVLEPQRAS